MNFWHDKLAWRDLAWLGELTHLKPFTWDKVGSPPQGHPILPTKWPYPQGHPTSQARFAVSHVNGWRWFVSNCSQTWLAPIGSAGGGEWEGGALGPQANFSQYKQGLNSRQENIYWKFTILTRSETNVVTGSILHAISVTWQVRNWEYHCFRVCKNPWLSSGYNW